MIISLSGRIKSGKGLISDMLAAMNFEKVTIASFLKNSIAQLYNIDISYCYDQKLKLQNLQLPWNKETAGVLSKIIGEDISALWKDGDEPKTFSNVRETMQYLGSEVFRRHDPDIHVKKALNLQDNKNYVCDDVRFLNEKEFIEQSGGFCIYIIRPGEWDSISNHISETSLNWSNFNHVIINDRDINYLERRIKSFLNNIKLESVGRKRLFINARQFSDDLDRCGDSTTLSKEYACSRDKIVWWGSRLLVPILKYKYQYDHKAFLSIDKQSAYFAGLISADGCIKKSGNSNRYVVELANNDLNLVQRFKQFVRTNKPIYSKYKRNGKISYSLVLNSPYIVNNIKLWNIKPRKSRVNEVPEILNRKENSHLIGYWFVGLIDGDGCITKNGHIRCLASKEIVEWLGDVYRDFNPRIYSEKGIDNLFCISFHGKYANDLSKVLPIQFGQERKWSRLRNISVAEIAVKS